MSISQQLPNPTPHFLEQVPVTAAQELMDRREARQSIKAFMRYMRPTHLLAFQHDPADHHDLIIDKLEEMVIGMEQGDPTAVKKFMLSMPPGSAKSTYVNVIAPTWMLARNPKLQILTLANSDQLAEQFSRDRRTIMLTTQWEKVAQTTLDKDAQSLKFQQTVQQGFIRAASQGATITGFRCDILLCDDLVSGYDVAQSQTLLAKMWSWFEHDARSRKKPHAIEFVIGTRWSTSDPIGMLLKRKEEGLEEIEYMKMPLLCSDPVMDPLQRQMGDLLWPQWYTPEMVADAKLSPLLFRTLYQQEPSDKAGEWCGDEHFQTELVAPDNLKYLMAVDVALTVGGGDWSVVTVAGIDQDRNLHFVDMWRAQTTPDQIADNIMRLFKRYKPIQCLIDNDNASKMFATVLYAKCRQVGKVVPLDFMKMGNRSKEERAAPLRGMLVQDMVYFVQAPWTPVAQDEILNFPSDSPTVHDDWIDTAALIAKKCSQITPPKEYEKDEVKHQMQIGPEGRICINDTLDDLFEDQKKGTYRHKFSKLRI